MQTPMLTVKILGSVCANCKKMEVIVRQAIARLAVEASIIKVTDYNDITAYNILSIPGLVINGKLMCAGRVPSQAEVSAWLANALEAAKSQPKQTEFSG